MIFGSPAIACGWRLYEDVERLTSLAGQVVTIDLLHGGCHVDGEPMDPPLGLTQDVSDWIRARFDSDGVPRGLVTGAHLTLAPRKQRGLVVACQTVVETAEGVYESNDTASWRPG